MKQRLRRKPLLRLRPLSVSLLLLSLVVVLHSVSSLEKSFDEESAFGQKRSSVYKEGGKQNPFVNPWGSEGQPSGQEITKYSSDCPSLKDLYREVSGVIKFPTTGDYKKNLLCKWRLNAPADKVFRMYLGSIDIDYSDRLDLYDDRTDSPSSLMASLYGKVVTSETFTSKSNVTLIRFKSDENFEGTGFQLIYRVIPKRNAKSGIQSDCGIPDVQPKVDSRIVGGVEATPHSWPWQVQLLGLDESGQVKVCGGSIFNSRWVITSAHCVAYPDTNAYELILGLHKTSQSGGTTQAFKPKEIVRHEDYHGETNENDIALIRLPEDVKFNRNVKPICLPDVDVKDGTRCVATGWGNTQSTGNEDVLNQVYLPVINNSQCNKPDWYGGRVKDTMICAGYPEGKMSACSGDFGGPLACLSDNKWKLFGLSSWVGGERCAMARRPTVFTRVKSYTEWIRKKTEQYE